MATVKQLVGARNSLPFTGTGLSTLAVDVGTTNTPTGNKQVVVFIAESLDGTNFRSGPTSGTTTSNEPNLKFLGTVPMNIAGSQIGQFSIAAALGYVPAAFFIIIKNDLGVALTSGTVFTAEISSTVI